MMHDNKGMGGCCRPSVCGAAMALVLGVLFLLGTLDVLPTMTFGTYWPLFLIGYGLHGVCCSCWKKKGMMMGEGKDGCCQNK
ncbi:hypothetical protein KBD59_05655 [Candidatus Gracilibacteria bacterium]|nr:hypothetical protein [Candidatus Gracilibacteria bacterium]